MKDTTKQFDGIHHQVQRGQFAPQAAVSAGLVDVVFLDPETGRQQTYGRLTARRQCGRYYLQLTEDTEHHLWWIIVNTVQGAVTLGYEARQRQECLQFLVEATEDEVYQLITMAQCDPV